MAHQQRVWILRDVCVSHRSVSQGSVRATEQGILVQQKRVHSSVQCTVAMEEVTEMENQINTVKSLDCERPSLQLQNDK